MRAFILTMLLASPALAEGNLGIGMQMGDGTGVTGKGWLGPDDAIQAAIGVRPFDGFAGGPALSADWVHEVVETDRSQVHLALHVGAGAGLGFSHGGCYRDAWGQRYCEPAAFARTSLRVPVGFDVLLTAAPVEIFMELVPGVQLAPATGRPELGGVLGARFYF